MDNKELEERIRKLDERVTQIEKTTLLFEYQYKTIMDSIIEMKSDIKEMKSNPAKRWELVITATITAVIGGCIGLLLAGIN